MTTLQDVARKAGVAPMTVSRVINHSGYTSPETRQRVEAAVAELGYIPNTLARGLRLRRSQTLALILTDITNPFFTTMARGAEDAASAAGYTVVFGNTDESEEKEQRYLDRLLQQQVDGILLVPAGGSNAAVQRILRHGTPLVVLDRQVAGEDLDLVRSDSKDGAYRLAKLLLDLGHRQIALLSGPRGVFTSDERVAGFRRALEEAGIKEPVVYYGGFTQDSGYDLTRQALAVHPRPTALVAANNFIALGVLRALRAADLDVPEDVALAAFDDLPANLMIEPFLTAAVQPAYEMGKQAAELLIRRLAGDELAVTQKIILPVELVIRASSGPALR